ncbi:MAG: DNRLRE domain-containing protein [Bacteroidetes bacterium]|nr:DNRLRE domain-containing protein [Bacteroidota bacterium]
MNTLNTMWKTTILAISFCFIFINTQAQTVLTLQPSAATGKDATLSNFPNEPTLNFGNNAEFISESSSINFNSHPKRSLIQFDLSSIPANATVISAYLSFYAYNLPGTGGHLVLNNNTGYLFKVTQPWNESTVTWSTQPTYSTADTVILGISDSSNQNYLNVDVRNQIQK